MSTDSSGQGRPPAQEVASTAAEQAGQVSAQAAAQAKDVAGTAADQTRQLGQEAAAQARSIVGQTTAKAHDQAEAQVQQLAGALGRVGDQARSLLAGKPEEAGSLSGYAENAVSKLDQLTRRVQEGGLDGVVGDVQRFARRRPGVFLLGAGTLGFAVGRLLRAGVNQQVNAQPSEPSGQGAGLPAASSSSVIEPAPAEMEAEMTPVFGGEGSAVLPPPPPPPPSQRPVSRAWSE